MKLFSHLTTSENKVIREVVIKELNKYKALQNISDLNEEQKTFCESLKKAVNRLPEIERFIIIERYLSQDSEYTTDYDVYMFRLEPPISAMTYSSIRQKAMIKIALYLNIDTGVDLSIPTSI